MGYVGGRPVTHYFVQRRDVNPAGRKVGWITEFSGDDVEDEAKAKAKELRKAGHETRIVKRKGTSGGYFSL